jgi:uncharacterized protein (DUF1015 family)
MRATRANLSPIFVLVPDEDGALRAALDEACAREPDVSLSGPDAARRRVWLERDAASLSRIEALLTDRPAVLADGHHRYETALCYRDELASQGADTAEADLILCHVVPTDDPGLVVLPTHRVVTPRGSAGPERLLAALGERFEVSQVSREEAVAFAHRAPEPGQRQAFVVALGRPARLYRATLRDAGEMARRAPDRAPAWRELDVPCLHLLVIEDILGIGAVESGPGRPISYTHDASAAIAAAEHEGGVSFILRPTTPDSVAAVARAGERMPQKSTYFHPKVAAGFAMRRLR